MITSDCKEGANKSNHPIQNPLLLVIQPYTRDNILLTLNHTSSKQLYGREFPLFSEVSGMTVFVSIIYLKLNIVTSQSCCNDLRH
jgi:hypothetical protein